MKKINPYTVFCRQVHMIQEQMSVLVDTQSAGEERYARVKQENATLQARILMLEESGRDAEARAEERLEVRRLFVPFFLVPRAFRRSLNSRSFWNSNMFFVKIHDFIRKSSNSRHYLNIYATFDVQVLTVSQNRRVTFLEEL